MSATASDGVPGTDEELTGPENFELTRQNDLRLETGWVGFDDEALYLERDGTRTRVAFGDVTELSYQDMDYFILVLSLVLVGFGLWFVGRTPASLLFSVVGVASFARLYRRRGTLVVRASGRAKPLAFHPADAGEFYDALGEALNGEVVSDRRALFGD